MIDIIGEIGSVLPWIYRGWLFLLLPRYRSNRHEAWNTHNKWYKWIDITASVIFVIFEIFLLITYAMKR